MWIGRVRSKKIPTPLRGMNICINYTSSADLDGVLCSNEMVPNAPKYYETRQNMSLGRMVWNSWVRIVKFRRDLMAWTFVLIVLVRPVFDRVSCSNKTVPNAPKHYETHQNMSLTIGVDRVCSKRKIPTPHRGMNFCINCTSSACFVPSSVQ